MDFFFKKGSCGFNLSQRFESHWEQISSNCKNVMLLEPVQKRAALGNRAPSGTGAAPDEHLPMGLPESGVQRNRDGRTA